MATAVDASIVIAWQNSDHIFHSEAVNQIGDAIPPLFISETNLAEVLVGIDGDSWADFIADLVAMGFERYNPLAEEAARARIDANLRLPDAYVVATARAKSADAVLTFDSNLNEAARDQGFTTNEIPAA